MKLINAVGKMEPTNLLGIELPQIFNLLKKIFKKTISAKLDKMKYACIQSHSVFLESKQFRDT